MGLWWWEGERAGGCWSYFGVSIQRGLSAWGWQGLGLTGTFTTWEVTPTDMDSNIKYYVLLYLSNVLRTMIG